MEFQNRQNQLQVDFTDLCAMRTLMDREDEFPHMLFGENEDGESVCLQIFNDNITTITSQKNGWGRINKFYRDGTREERYTR